MRKLEIRVAICAAIVVALSLLSCRDCRSTGPSIIRQGMEAGEASELLLKSGATSAEHAYHFPSRDDQGSLYHSRFFELASGACLEIVLKVGDPEDLVHTIRIAPDHLPYPGKIEWISMRQNDQLIETSTYLVSHEVRK